MFLAHEVLLFDLDIFIALILFFAGFFIMAYFQPSNMTMFWAIISGFYIYIVPFFGCLLPFILFGLIFIGVPILNAYISVVVMASMASLLIGNHSMYLMFDGLILAGVIFYKYKVPYRYLSDLVKESNV